MKKATDYRLLSVIQAGFEPTTYGLEGRCSIQLSYWTNTFTVWRCKGSVLSLHSKQKNVFYRFLLRHQVKPTLNKATNSNGKPTFSASHPLRSAFSRVLSKR